MGDHNEPDHEPIRHDHDDGKNPTADVTEHNPSAPARRRLIRALGGSGALGLATLAAGGWKKPVVDSVVLPIHAAVSPAVSPAACEIGASITVSNSNTQAASLGACIDLIGGGQTMSFGCYTAFPSGISATGTASGGSSVSAGPGTYTLRYSWDPGNTLSGVTLTNAVSIVCCNDATGTLVYLDSTSISSVGLMLTISDAGECSLGA
jgi:hypothetical protein